MKRRAALALATSLALIGPVACSDTNRPSSAAKAEHASPAAEGPRAREEDASTSPGAQQPSVTNDVRESPEPGDAKAQRALAIKYYRGDGVPKNAALAAEWLRKAAEQGDPESQTLLAAMYTLGDGVPKDAPKAVEWYRKAAEQGFASAQLGLGGKYALGDGVARNLVEAYKWTNLAAASGNTQARDRLDELEEGMTKEEHAEAEKLAREWLEAHRGRKQ
jgi:TPR repeat protein